MNQLFLESYLVQRISQRKSQMVLEVITKNWFMLFKLDIPQLPLKNFMKKLLNFEASLQTTTQEPSLFPATTNPTSRHNCALIQAPSPTTFGIHPTTIPIGISYHKMVDHFHLLTTVPLVHTQDISKSADNKATLLKGVPLFSWF